MNDPQPSPAEQPPAPRRRRAGTIARWSFGTLALTALAVVGAGVYVVKTESGTRLAWNSAVRMLDGKLTGQLLGGTIADGLRLRELHYRDERRILSIDRIDASWHLALAARKLTVRYLRVGTVELNQQPAPPEPSTTPESLEIPLALELHEIALDRLSFTEGTSTTELSKLRLHGDSDGRQHTLVLDSLVTPFGEAAALLHLDGKTPFAVSGGLELSGQYQNASLQEKYRLAAQLSGSLHELGVALKATGDRLNGSADIQATPFAAVPLKSAKVDLQHLNPQAFNAAAPQADLRVTADLAPVAASETLRVAGTVGIDNARPGSLDRQLLPLLSARAHVELGLDEQTLSKLEIRLPKNGRLDGSGQFHASGEGQFDFRIAGLDLNQIHRQLKPTQLAGPLQVTLAPASQQIKLALDDRDIKLRLDSSIGAEQVELRQASLAAGRSRLEASGKLNTSGAMGYAIKGRLVDFDPTAWLHALTPSDTPKGRGGKPAPAAPSKPVQARINMDFNASGAISPELQLKLAFGIHDSSYGELPMSGQGEISLAGRRLLPSKANLLVAGNTLALNGSFGSARDRLDLKLDAPHLERLGYGLSGLLRLEGQLTGSQQRPALHATYQAENLVFAQHRLARLGGGADLQANLAAGIDSPDNKLSLRVQGQGYQGPQARLDKLDVDLDGTWNRHTLSLRSNGRVMDQPLDLDVAAHGKLTQPSKGAYGWDGVIDRLQNKGFPRFAMTSPLNLQASADAIIAGPTRIEIDRMALELKRLSIQQGRIASAGQAHGLDIGRLLQIAQSFTGTPPPLKTDLVLDSDWDFSLAERASGFIQVARKSGDVRVTTTNGEAALGLSELRLRADLQDQQMRVDGRINAARVGSVDLGGAIGLLRVDKLLTLADASPLNLKAHLDVPELNRVGDLVGPQLSLKGKLGADLSAGGSLGQPRLSGAINGDNLAVTEFDQGIQLKDGIVRIVMDNNVIDLRQIEFHGGEGTLRANGKVQLGASNPDLNATITAERLELFASPDRRLMISGQGRIANVNEQLRVDGKFTVDRALFDLPKSSAPKLGDDVVVVRRGERAKSGANATSQQKLEAATEKPAGKFAPVINLAVDLGNNFRFRGTGADLLLRGDMNVRSEPLSPLRASGTINVAEGTYEAFGTKLNIERGIINFQGPISNPNLNILAMRRNQDVAAGVSVTGNVSQPRVQLVSEPNVPDDEKLSWMMFGHGTDSASIGQRSASSQALALVGNLGGKRIAKDIGLDQFSIGASESGLTDDQVVNLGKAITEKITLGYEQSLAGAASVAKATWQLSQRWSVVVRAGTINGLNVLFNRRFD
ncbi:translocation/assembly module TamB domain-containing protein [Herbaspirillum sp. alder98]|uniref:translocation/assembly module TamB domain-containing protein n=1 Tax=Herbaspirillum sp. alder98 TaxID=2913096 RepID=UPI001CD824F4|nr:translocation/assembly module TamB domain-containing protein [Herbaspirillum sp. alder98]MCA1324599.1 translocation/assembly module TamB domain-containing protein [Herbaspirillum sp. alder98]